MKISQFLKLSNLRINLMRYLNQTKNFQKPGSMYSHVSSFGLMNKGIITTQSDVESCNRTPHKKNHKGVSNSENLYFTGRVSSDANP
jgi:hypothetical protein